MVLISSIVMVLPLAWGDLQDESSIALVACDSCDSSMSGRYPSVPNEFRLR
ncbi:hypothetical protein NHJ13734_008724 [Beauveria thailandica]